MSDEQAKFEGWARVEVMGHQSHIGFVRTEAYGGAVLFRIDTPALPEREFILESPEYAQEGDCEALRRWCPAGTKVKRIAREGVTVLVGSGSIYRIIPCTEAAALRAIDQTTRARLMLLALPEGLALPPAEPVEQEDDDEEEYSRAD